MSLFARPSSPPALAPMPADPLRVLVAGDQWARWPSDYQTGLANRLADPQGVALAVANLATMRKALEGARRHRGLVADGLRAAGAIHDPQWKLLGPLATAVRGGKV